MNLNDVAKADHDGHMLLLASLVANADEVGRDEVAFRLGMTREELDEHLAGRTDVTFTELRRLAIACGLVIGYVTLPSDREVIPAEGRNNLGMTLTLGQRIARVHKIAQEVTADVELAHLSAAEMHAETLRRIEAADSALAESAMNGADR